MMSESSEQQNPVVSTAVLIPCYNEAATIQTVIRDFHRELPQADIIVFDNNSQDDSVALAREAGARIIFEKKQGKGNVVRSMFDLVDADVYVLVDGDDTYSAKDVHRLMEPVMRGDADMVVGTRLDALTDKSMNALHRFGNRLMLNIIYVTFHIRLKDMLSGYRIMNRTFVENIPILSSGFEIETEMSLQAMERGMRIIEMPAEYRARPDGSTSKLKPFRDGTRILFTIMSIFRDYRPMSFFSVIAGIIFASGIGFGSVVIIDYFEQGIVRRLPMAVLATSLAILSFLVLITGFIVSTINRRFTEQDILLSRKIKRRVK